MILTLRISLCDIYSVVASYLLHDFYNYINDKNISKLSKQLFILLLKNPKINKRNENDIVKFILLWLDDEINIKEDITEIFYLIKWEEVDDELIFELLFKYSYFILNDNSLENLFLEIYLNKLNHNKNTELIFKRIFQVIKKLEYCKLFGQIKKDEKIIENFLNKKRNKEINIKEKNIENNIKYIDKCVQTDYIEDDIKNNKDNNIININENNIEKKNKYIIKQKCDWNIRKMKHFISNQNSPKKLTIKNKKGKKREKANSYKTTKRTENNNINIIKNKKENKSKSIDRKDNHKFNSSIQSSNMKIDNILPKKTRNKNNISIIKKTKDNSKIKEMQIFPVNFSSLKRFKKENKTDENNINNKKQRYERDNYFSEREDKKEKKKYIKRIYSEKKVKISFGIVKEICFMNNV